MEPITHLLTGACMARAGLNRKSVLATATLVIAAEAPDIDSFTEFGGRVFGFAHHRGITHAFVGSPLVAAGVVALLYGWYRFRRRGKGMLQTGPSPRWGLLFAFAWIAATSHILLDFTNNYGVRPFMPFSYKWYSWDIVFIIEPVIWVLLLGGLLLPLFFGMVDKEVGVRRNTPRGRVGAILSLLALVAFWGVRDYEHRRAVAAMESITYRGADPIRVSAYPYWVNPFRWYGLVETKNSFQGMEVNSRTPEVDPRNRAVIHYKPEETPVTLSAKSSYLGRVYLDWAQYPIVETEQLQPPESGYVVRFYDLRFMYPNQKRKALSAWVQLDTNLKVIGEDFGVRNLPVRGDTERAGNTGQE